jgi:hypothetical protein
MAAALSAAEIPRYCEIISTGQARDPTNPLDTRRSTGFLCGVEFVKGPLCCMRLCMCKDFLALLL